jgi:hypothetical protein
MPLLPVPYAPPRVPAGTLESTRRYPREFRMPSFTAPIKVDPVLKENFLALRDALGVLPTEQATAILEAARAQATAPEAASPTPVPAPEATTTSPTPVASTATKPERLLNRPVPSGLVGIFARLLDRAQEDPSRVRAALIRATKFL